MKDEFIPFMGYQWLQIEDDTVTIGISEEGLSELADISSINLPTENEEVDADEICGEIDTDEGPLNLYAPVDGRIIEVNVAVVENPNLLLEDPLGDGWLFRLEANSHDDLEELAQGSTSDED